MTAVSPLVLVVDDDRSVRKSLTRVLASAGYAVEAFASAREFLARPPHPGPCCLVLDVRMPGLTGLELQERLVAEGLGMGLAIVRTIVDAHGGKLGAVSNAEGGATVHFTVPVETEGKR